MKVLPHFRDNTNTFSGDLKIVHACRLRFELQVLVHDNQNFVFEVSQWPESFKFWKVFSRFPRIPAKAVMLEEFLE